MIQRGVKFIFYMIPVIWNYLKDFLLENVTHEEIRTHYLFGKANAYDLANDFNKAVSVYKEILKQDPTGIPACLNLGGLYYRRGMFEAAIPYYEKVIHINPKHYQGHYWLAMCLSKMERYHAAINTLEEVIQYLPTFKDALNLIGECYERIGESAKAEHCYLKALGTDPNGIIVQEADRTLPFFRREERVKH